MSIVIIIPTTVPTKNGTVLFFKNPNKASFLSLSFSSDVHSSSILLASFTISHSLILSSAVSRTTKYASSNTSLPVLFKYTIFF